MSRTTHSPSLHSAASPRTWLRPFSKLTVFATLFLIFAGGMVTSTGSGLAVPDWPLSYGQFFPPMVGGVFYEHGHRMIATGVGFLTVILAVGLAVKDDRRWVKTLGFFSLGAVICQGLLGGLTVLMYLPTPVSVGHGVLAQIFLILTIVIAYSLSAERASRSRAGNETTDPVILRFYLLCAILIFVQLVIGAVMRHSGSGLAVYGFPDMAGRWVPVVDTRFLNTINGWRFGQNLDPVNSAQVGIHLLHRFWAVGILAAVVLLDVLVFSGKRTCSRRVFTTTIAFNILFGVQIALGALSVLSIREPVLTSLHVVTGAALLGLSVIGILRASTVRWAEFRKQLGWT